MKNKTVLPLLAAIAFSAASAFGQGAETEVPKVHSWTTVHLSERYDRLTQRFKENSFGIYWGPMRWVSHAIDEKKSRDEFFAVSKELNRRGQKVSTQIPQRED
jgi:hypothetical protein